MYKMTLLLKEILGESNNEERLLHFLQETKPLWLWPNESTIIESVENDSYVYSYSRYITNQVIKKFLNILTKNEKTLLSTNSYEDLNNKTIDLSTRIQKNAFVLNDLDKDKKDLFKSFVINFEKIKPDSLLGLHTQTPKNLAILDLYILDNNNNCNAARLKKIIYNKSNIDHEITHALDIKSHENLDNVTKNMNTNKYNLHREYYSNCAYEYHAFTNQIISKLEDMWKNNYNVVLNLIQTRDKNEFFNKL